MLRWLAFIFLLAGFSGCAKPDLPVMIVRSSTPGELTIFRAELGNQFRGEQLQAFDTAVQELKLDAMNRDVAPAAARDQDACAAVNGKTVRQAEILGWQARHARLEREIALMASLLEGNLKKPNADPAHVQNAQEILVRLKTQQAETEQRLTDWTAKRD